MAHKSSSYWELGNLYYKVALSLKKFEVEPEYEKAIEFFKLAIKNYSKDEIIKGWRASANYDLAQVYIGRSQKQENGGYVSGSTLRQDREQALKYMNIALTEFRKPEIKENYWVTKVMDDTEEIIKMLEK